VSTRVALLCGGVGGAKLARGLHLLNVELTVIVNTGDDFEHLGFLICPDIDTVLYTLSGQASRAQGRGREDERWSFMRVLRSLGGEDWFQLGDGDLALHTYRTERSRHGARLSEITAAVCRAWQIQSTVLPMSDEPVRTMVHTDEGVLPFQRYFVAGRCEPRTQAIRFAGADTARPARGVDEAIARADVVVIAPSNPYLSIDPILSVPGIRTAVDATRAPVIAVSPLIAGKAVKGPTDKLMRELGVEASHDAIATHYAPCLDGLLIHQGDAGPRGDLPVRIGDTLMRDDEDRMRVAREVLVFGEELAR